MAGDRAGVPPAHSGRYHQGGSRLPGAQAASRARSWHQAFPSSMVRGWLSQTLYLVWPLACPCLWPPEKPPTCASRQGSEAAGLVLGLGKREPGLAGPQLTPPGSGWLVPGEGGFRGQG